MARHARKSGSASKSKAGARSARTTSQTELQDLIGSLIQAKRRGDQTEREKSKRALSAISLGKGSIALRQVAAEASTIDTNPVLADSLRLLGDIAARLEAAGGAKRP